MKAKAVKERLKLRVNVNPNQRAWNYRIKILKKMRGKWKTVERVHAEGLRTNAPATFAKARTESRFLPSTDYSERPARSSDYAGRSSRNRTWASTMIVLQSAGWDSRKSADRLTCCVRCVPPDLRGCREICETVGSGSRSDAATGLSHLTRYRSLEFGGYQAKPR